MTKVDDFEVIGHIGCGSFGVCKKIRRKMDGRILVWKELHYGAMSEVEKQMLVSEVNLLRELRHPHIVRYYGHILDRSTATLYIIMEYCQGGDLGVLIRQYKQERRHIEEEFIWQVVWQLALALRECHGRKKDRRAILHRDLKPANVFLDAVRNVKLGDFGVARVLSNESSLAKTFVGTPSYMSPEQMTKKGYNEKSDVWSLGCLVYELCSLVPPFTASTQAQLAAKITEGKVHRIPSIYSNDLHSLTSSMLTVENELRPSIDMILHHPRLMLLQGRERRAGHRQKLPLKEKDRDGSSGQSGDDDRSYQKQNNVRMNFSDIERREKLFADRERILNDREEELNRREKWIKIQEELFKEKIDRMSKYEKLFKELGIGVEERPVNVEGNPKKSRFIRKGSTRSLTKRKLTRLKRVRFGNDDDGSVREAETSMDDVRVLEYEEKCCNKENTHVRSPLEVSFNTRMGTIKTRLKAAQRRALHLRMAEMESRMQSIIL